MWIYWPFYFLMQIVPVLLLLYRRVGLYLFPFFSAFLQRIEVFSQIGCLLVRLSMCIEIFEGNWKDIHFDWPNLLIDHTVFSPLLFHFLFFSNN